MLLLLYYLLYLLFFLHLRVDNNFRFKLLKKLDNFCHLEIKPRTGRHHQIRVQLANIGCIIKGDLKYGSRRSNKDASIHLLAKKLEFLHPVKKEAISITAPAPKESVWNACKQS